MSRRRSEPCSPPPRSSSRSYRRGWLATAAAEEARGDERAALERYVEAVELQPENWRPWYELGQFELLTGRRERAIRHLRRARQLDPLGPANDELVRLGL
jgi:Flp pilus assembly protein TadD